MNKTTAEVGKRNNTGVELLSLVCILYRGDSSLSLNDIYRSQLIHQRPDIETFLSLHLGEVELGFGLQ